LVVYQLELINHIGTKATVESHRKLCVIYVPMFLCGSKISNRDITQGAQTLLNFSFQINSWTSFFNSLLSGWR